MRARFLLTSPLLPLILCVLLAQSLHAIAWQPESASWQLIKETDQQRIHTAEVAHSRFKAFKAETIIAQPIDAILAVIAHPESCPLWVDGCLQSKSLGVRSFADRYGYALNHLPWPFRDRELIVHIYTRSQEPGNVSITMRAIAQNEALPDYVERPPALESTTRIEQSHAQYTLRAVNEEHTEVVWIQHMEPGGNLPAWLVNIMLTELPDKSLRALSRVAGQPPYRDSKIHYDTNGQVIALTLGNGKPLNVTANSVISYPAPRRLTGRESQ